MSYQEGDHPNFAEELNPLMAEYLASVDQEAPADVIVARTIFRFIGKVDDYTQKGHGSLKVSTQKAAEFLVYSVEKSETALAAVIGVVLFDDIREETFPERFRDRLGLDKDENVRFLLHLAAERNRMHLEGVLGDIERNTIFGKKPERKTGPLGDEIQEVRRFQQRVLAPASTTTPAMRK